MVLPFGLNPDGEHNTMNQTIRLPPGMSTSGKTNVSTVVPVIPCPYIDFIVVNREDRYMIRCDRKSVLESSVELAKLIHAGPNSGRKGDNHFQVQNVDKYDFELMIRFFEQKFIKYRDHLHIIKILELAERFNCPDLAIHCIRELDLQLSSATVIDIYRALWYYQGIQPPNQHFGPYVARTKSNENNNKKTTTRRTGNETTKRLIPFTPEEYGSALLHNTLQLIEMQAELVLATPQITELRFEELELIVKREALQLSTELELFNCLSNWSYAECRRRNLDTTDENRCKVLGPLCLVPRFLLMTLSEFNSACKRLECLNRTEAMLIHDALDGKKLKNLTAEQAALFEKFRTPRPEFPKMPIHLSDRSHPRNYTKKMRQAEKKSGGGGCLESFGLNCLAAFACIFD